MRVKNKAEHSPFSPYGSRHDRVNIKTIAYLCRAENILCAIFCLQHLEVHNY